jgi:tRNA threonylcarbamoyl adenosine modification protein YeaZ
VFVLAFDTSSQLVTVAVTVGADVIERHELAPNRHGERLAPLIDEVLQVANISARQLESVGVGLGPGPFTGLRVGIVTAAAMADALEVPAYGFCSLDAIAAAIAPTEAEFLVVTDARRRQVYWAHYDEDGARLAGPEVDLPHAVADRHRGEIATVVGAGAGLYAEAFTGFEIGDVQHPSARLIATAALARLEAGEPPDALAPLYLRRPDAVPPGPPKKVTQP